MKESGVVRSVKGKEITVGFKRHSACFSCRACSADSGGKMVIEAIASDKMKLKAGDNVVVDIDSASLLKAIAFVYILPTAAFLAGALAGLRIAPLLGIFRHKEIISMLTGLLLLCASLFLARQYGIRMKRAYQAKITGKI